MNWKVDTWTEVELHEYNGKYSLQEGFINKEDKFQPVWVTGKIKGMDKKMPKGVKLGDKETALATLKAIYQEISGSSEAIPF